MLMNHSIFIYSSTGEYDFFFICVGQVSAANIVESQHVKEQTDRLQQQIQQLHGQVLGLTQARDDLSVQLQVRERERIIYNCFGAKRDRKKTFILKWPGKKKDVKQMYNGLDRKRGAVQRDKARENKSIIGAKDRENFFVCVKSYDEIFIFILTCIYQKLMENL